LPPELIASMSVRTNMQKPRVGILFFGNEWFWSQKMNGFGPEFLKLIESDIDSTKENLSSFLEVVSSGIIFHEDKAKAAAIELREERVDLVIFCPVVWSSDRVVLAALSETDSKLPVIMWCSSPYRELSAKITVPELVRTTGTVGALQSASAMKRLGRSLIPIAGTRDDERVLKEIHEYSVAAKVTNELKRMKVGLLPWRYEDMVGTYVDEAKVLSKLGPKMEPVSVGELFRASEQVTESELKSFVEYLKKNFDIVGVSEKSLLTSGRASLALAKIVEQHNLDAIAIQDMDDEMHTLLKTRPCLRAKSMAERHVPVGMEGDALGALSMIVLQKLTDKAAIFCEIFTFDVPNNSLLMGHIGVPDPSSAQDPSRMKIVPDREFQHYDEVEGACMYFTHREGIVTLLAIVSEAENFRMIVSRGESLPIGEKLEGYAHMVVRIDPPVKHFLETALLLGANQHWAVVNEDAVKKLEKLAELMGLEKTIIV